MKISVILAHPQVGSFNHAIASTAVLTLREAGHEVFFHDLYQERFDPLLTASEIGRDAPLPAAILTHCKEIVLADGIIVIHPNWWGMPPAILKGWVDRVIRPGVAYEFLEGDNGEGVPRGLLAARAALVFNTSNTEDRREHNIFHDPLDTLWRNCIFGLCGVKAFYRRMFNIMITSSPQQRAAWLEEVARAVRQAFPPMGVSHPVRSQAAPLEDTPGEGKA